MAVAKGIERERILLFFFLFFITRESLELFFLLLVRFLASLSWSGHSVEGICA